MISCHKVIFFLFEQPFKDMKLKVGMQRQFMAKLACLILLSLILTQSMAWADFEEDISATAHISPDLRQLRAHAEAGDADAQLQIGSIFFKGQEVEQDYAESAKWFQLAALQGNTQARFNLGMMYDTGQGVVQDQSLAVKWYRLAAEQGLALAQLNLGVAYATGQGVLHSDAEAANWMRRAAAQGEAQAQFNLGVMYANGQGVERNLTTAYKWAGLASAQGHATARALEKDLALRLHPEQQTVTLQNTSMPTGGEYYLQLAAFKSPEEAEKYVKTQQKKLKNFDKSISIFTHDGWVRTQMGPYSSLSEARRNATRLKSVLGYQPLLKAH